MKEFLMKFDESGHPVFVDIKDKAVYERLLSSFRENKIEKFKMSVSTYQRKVTLNQENLFKVIVDMISKETGNDSKTTEITLLEDFNKSKKDIREFTHEEFQMFLEHISNFCSEFFNFNLILNEFGNIEINKF